MQQDDAEDAVARILVDPGGQVSARNLKGEEERRLARPYAEPILTGSPGAGSGGKHPRWFLSFRLRPTSLEGLADDGLELLRRRPPRVSKVDLVMLASEPMSLVRYETMNPVDGGSFIGVGTDVQDLSCSAFSEGSEPQAREGR